MINSYNTFLPKAEIVAPQATSQLANSAEKAGIRKAAEEFEALFITEMLRPIFEESETDVDPMFGGGFGEEMFKSLLTDEYGKGVSTAGGFGLADSIQAQMLQYQEVK